MTPQGAVTEFTIPTAASSPRGIAAGPDGNVWFTQTAVNRIGRITASGAVTEFIVPTTNSSPNDITAGPDGNLWFSQSSSANKVARITTSGTITEYPLPNANSSPRQITTGTDGSIWFLENFGSRIGRVTSGVSPEDRRPAMSGSGQVALPLVCGADVWGLSSTVTIGWQRNGIPIPGESLLAYTPRSDEVGATITCTSTARFPGVAAALTATSNNVTVVAQLTGPAGPPGPPGPAGAPAAGGAWRPSGRRAPRGSGLAAP